MVTLVCSHYVPYRSAELAEEMDQKVSKDSHPIPQADKKTDPALKAGKKAEPVPKTPDKKASPVPRRADKKAVHAPKAADKRAGPTPKAADRKAGPAHKAGRELSPAHRAAAKKPSPVRPSVSPPPTTPSPTSQPSTSPSPTSPTSAASVLMRGDKKDRSRPSKIRAKRLDKVEPFDLSTQEVVLHDWSTYLHTPPSPKGEILDEIGRHFAMVTKDPSRRQRASHLQGPKLKRLSAASGGVDGGSVPRRKKGGEGQSSQVSPSRGGLVAPIRSSGIRQHDGNIVLQPLEDTTGVQLLQHYEPELLLLRSKTRVSLKDFTDSLPPSSAPSNHALETFTIPPPPSTDISMLAVAGSSSSSPEHSLNQSGQSTEMRKSRHSLLLESKEDGDMETE